MVAALALASAGLAAKPKVLTDDTITDQVRLKLADDQIVKGGALQVVVKQGVVTLSGTVESKQQQERAPKLAGKVKGVKQVINNITLRDKNLPR
jgi:hyperosmotically inducible protein